MLRRLNEWLGEQVSKRHIRPCEVCRLGRGERWEYERVAVRKVSWYLPRIDKRATLRICEGCGEHFDACDGVQAGPLAFMRQMVDSGRAKRPPAAAYLENPGWRLYWQEVFTATDAPVFDESTAREQVEIIEVDYFGAR